MIAVIFGLVAVVLLVLVVVALGMRSMNRRESNLPPERLRKMAEQATDPTAKRPGRPAEETFFESFPEGFDAFQEPERATARLRPGNGRPASRPAGRPGGRPAPRGKQAASSRGRRGVDEWGDADDYDDDYWTRVRADDGAFGGTIAARVGASRPDLVSPSAPASPSARPTPPKDRQEADANAATVQAPLPTRPTGLADLVEPARNTSSAAASERTATFSAPIPQAPAPAASAADVLGAIGTSQQSSRTRRPSRPDPADPLGIADSARAKPRRRSDSGGDPGRTAPGRGADPRRTDARRGTAGRAEPGRTGAGRPDAAGSAVTGPAGRPATGRSTADPLSGGPLTTGPLPGGPHPTGSLGHDPLSSGPLSNGAASRGPLFTGPGSGDPRSGNSPATGPTEAARGGAFDAGRSSTGSYEAPRATGGARGTGSLPTPGSYDPLGTTPATGDSPAGQSWPAQPAYPATGSYDILDGPATPAAGSSKETWKASDYQLPSYDGYATRDTYTPETSYTAAPPTPVTPSAPSYEVRPGWATIDDSDSANGPTPAGGLPMGPSRAGSAYDTNAGRDLPQAPGVDDSPSGSALGYGAYEADRYSAPDTSSAPWPQQPRPNTGGSWPSYGELYGSGTGGAVTPDPSPTQSSQASPRGGHRRPADTDYPDYYR
ncbi:hypothetical protein GCM10022226_15620 [Sphaerisporangium flaviroseum]|uniref:Uncharacterized protein n=1 Tax=Sphaerisporangium flaviroseum TaxID=509199 RepID=A0ABP7HM64_9ACTN